MSVSSNINAVSAETIFMNLGQIFAVFVVALLKCCLYRHLKSHPQVAVIMSCFLFLSSHILFFRWFVYVPFILTPPWYLFTAFTGPGWFWHWHGANSITVTRLWTNSTSSASWLKEQFLSFKCGLWSARRRFPKAPTSTTGWLWNAQQSSPNTLPSSPATSTTCIQEPYARPFITQSNHAAEGQGYRNCHSTGNVKPCSQVCILISRIRAQIIKIFILPCWWCISELNNLMVQVFISTWHALALSWQVGGNYCFLVDGAFSTLYLCSYHTGFGFHSLRDYHVLTSCKIDL